MLERRRLGSLPELQQRHNCWLSGEIPLTTSDTGNPLDAAVARTAPREAFAYKAFISYSHSLDDTLAAALQRALHRLARPWYQLRALRIFRDKTNLSATPHLWGSIEQALAQSEFLLLLASPTAARSKWVGKEIDWWLRHRSSDRLLLVLTAGDLRWDDTRQDLDWERTTALPRTLAGRFSQEPKHIDCRWARGSSELTLRNPRFLEAVLDVAAPLHGRDRDALGGDDVREQRRTRALAWSAVVVLLVTTIVAVWQAAVATRERRQAVARQLAAQSELMRTQHPARADTAAALALEAMRRHPSSEVDQVLWRSLTLLPERVWRTEARGWIASAEFTSDASGLAVGSTGGDVKLLAAESGAVLYEYSHPQSVFHVAIGPRNRHLASASEDGTVRVIDIPSKSVVAQLRHDEAVRHVVFARNGRWVATASADGSARIWSTSDWRQRARIEHRGTVWRATFTRDDRHLVTGGRDGSVAMWRVERPAEITRLSVNSPVTSLAGDRTRPRVVIGTAAGNAEVRDVPSGRLVARFAHPTEVLSAVFSDDGELVATGTSGSAHVWSVATRREVHRFDNLTFVPSVAFSPDQKLLVTSGEVTRVWALASGREVNRFPETAVTHVARFAPDSGRVVTGNIRGEVRLWQVTEGVRELFASGSWRGGEDHLALPLLHKGAFAFSPDARQLAAAHPDGAVLLFLSAAFRRLPLPHAATVTAITYSPDGSRIATAADDGQVRLWATHTGELLTSLAHDVVVWDVAFQSDGTVVTAADDGRVRVWDLASGSVRRELAHGDSAHAVYVAARDLLLTGGTGDGLKLWRPGGDTPAATLRHGGNVTAVSFDRARSRVVTGATDGHARVWDVRSGALVRDLYRDSELWALALQPHAGLLAEASGRDNEIRVWNPRTREIVVRMTQAWSAWSLAFSRTGEFLAIGGQDGNVSIRRVADSHEVVFIPGSGGTRTNVLAFSPDDRFLLSVDDNRVTRLWAWRNSDVEWLACKRIGNALDRATWALYLPGAAYAPLCQ